MPIDNNTMELMNAIITLIINGHKKKHIVRHISSIAVPDTEVGCKWKRRKMKQYLRHLHFHATQMIGQQEAADASDR